MKRPRPTLRVYARLVPHLTYGLYHISGWGCLSLCISDAKMFTTEGPDRGVIETIGDRCCGICFSQDRNRFSLSKTPSRHVKLAQAKVEKRLTLLCLKG